MKTITPEDWIKIVEEIAIAHAEQRKIKYPAWILDINNPCQLEFVPEQMPINNKVKFANINLVNMTNTPFLIHGYQMEIRHWQAPTIAKDSLRADGLMSIFDSPRLKAIEDGIVCETFNIQRCRNFVRLPEDHEFIHLELRDLQLFKTLPKHGTFKGGEVRFVNLPFLDGIPSWLTNVTSLLLQNCPNVKKLPANMVIKESIDLAGSGLTGLPKGLRGKIKLLWRSVEINEQLAFHPERITAKAIFAESNIEIRRIMLERMGYEKFTEEAEMRVIHESLSATAAWEYGEKMRQAIAEQGAFSADAMRYQTMATGYDWTRKMRLLRCAIPREEDLVGVEYYCPSTDRRYFTRVPLETKTCEEAIAYICGFDSAELYKPLMES